jgi:hypothetical protein
MEEVTTESPGLRVFPIGAGKKFGVTNQGFYYVHHSSTAQKHIYRYNIKVLSD